jgi:hypothetical protein
LFRVQVVSSVYFYLHLSCLRIAIMAQPQGSFNWRDYIELRDDPASKSDPMERVKAKLSREQFETILNRLAQTPEGRELIQKAHEVQSTHEKGEHEEKHKIQIGTPNAAFTLDGKPMEKKVGDNSFGAAETHQNSKGEYEGKVAVSLGMPGALAFMTPDGKPHVVSQTEVLVHELSHLADPNQLPHVKLARYREVIREELSQTLHIDADDKTRTRVLDAAADRVMGDLKLNMQERNKDFTVMELDKVEARFAGYMQKLRNEPEAMAEFTGKLQETAGGQAVTMEAPPAEKPRDQGFARMHGSVAGQDDYPAPPPKGTLQAADKVQIVHPGRGASRTEEQAVDFSDRLLMKNFDVPLRQGYGNLFQTPKGTQAPQEPELLAKPLADDKLPAYKPDIPPASLGALPTPLNFGSPLPAETRGTGK